MNHNLPKVTIAGLATVWLIGTAQAQHSPESMAGQQMVAEAARQLANQPSVEAQLRQRVELYGRFLVGSGSYRQLTAGRQRMFRLEMKLQVADQLTSLLQVSNGTTLWIRRGLDDTKELAYVNLGRVREAIQDSGKTPGGLPADQLAVGGLHQLLHGLNECFNFGQPMAAQIGNQPVWKLTGHWKPEKLAQRFPALQTDGKPVDLAKLPAHVPTLVALDLGRDDEIPLFPYQIEYIRVTAVAGRDKAADHRKIATMDLFEVRRYRNFDRRHFMFQPVDEQVEDRTEMFLRKLGLDDDRIAARER